MVTSSVTRARIGPASFSVSSQSPTPDPNYHFQRCTPARQPLPQSLLWGEPRLRHMFTSSVTVSSDPAQTLWFPRCPEESPRVPRAMGRLAPPLAGHCLIAHVPECTLCGAACPTLNPGHFSWGQSLHTLQKLSDSSSRRCLIHSLPWALAQAAPSTWNAHPPWPHHL